MNSPQIPPDSKTKIVTEAERLFRHYGYAKTTMAEIAEACDMSAANLYRFYPSKQALVGAICSRIISELEGSLYTIVRADEPAALRLERFIKELHRHTLENLLDHRKVHEMVVVAMDEQWPAVSAHLERVAAYIGEIIKDGIARGEFRTQDNVTRTAKCVHAALVSLCHPMVVAQKLADEDRPTPNEMAALIVHSLK